MFRKKKTNLRELIDSVNKQDFNNFKAAVEKKTEESETVKKLYEKWSERSIPKDRYVLISFKEEGLKKYISMEMTEYFSDKNGFTTKTKTECVVNNDDDVKEAIARFGYHLLYRCSYENESILHMYISHKIFQYDIELDDEVYFKLRNIIESLI